MASIQSKNSPVMARWCLSAALLLLVVIEAVQGTTDNVITQWNAQVQRLSRERGIPSQIAARNSALLHLSQYKALHLAYKKGVKHPEAAAAYAGHFILTELNPALQSPRFDGVLAKQILPLNLSKKEDGVVREIALAYAVPLVRDRAFDGSQIWVPFQPSPPGGPAGKYQFTPNQTFSIYPQLATTKPFVIKSAKRFDVYGGPPKVPSAEYDEQYKITVKVGDSGSAYQTQALKDTARFWEDGSNTSQVSAHLFNISLAAVGKDLSLKETAKLFAVYAVASYDASIATWYQKYKYLYWRPVTAVRQGDPTHKPYPQFTPLLNTPPHPEYPSGHSSVAGAYASVVAKFLGKSPSSKTSKPFSVATESYLLPPRSYNTIDAPAKDIAISRVYGGIHFQRSSEDGYKIGVAVGKYVWGHFVKAFGDL